MKNLATPLPTATSLWAVSRGVRITPRLLFCNMFLVMPVLFGAVPAECYAQQTARDYYSEAYRAHALPDLPYVCFRATEKTSRNPVETPYNDPTFVMLGMSKEVAQVISEKHESTMSIAEREKLKQLRNTDFLYVQAFDHGVFGPTQVYQRKEPNDVSRSSWVADIDRGAQQVKWEFIINWGTLKFEEKITSGANWLNEYGSCQLVDLQLPAH